MPDQQPNLTPAERELESALASLRPAAVPFDLERLRLRAAVTRAQRTTRAWQAIAAAVTLAAGVALFARSPRVVDRIVLRDRPTTAAETTLVVAQEAGPRLAYLEMRDKVLANGPAAVETTPVPFADDPARPVRAYPVGALDF